MYVVESMLDERVHHKACRPDTHSNSNLTFLLRFQSEATGVFGRIRRAWETCAEFLDVVLGFDFDTVAVEEAECVLGEVFVEHGEDFGGYVVDCYIEVGNEGWVEFLEILVAEVEEFGGELDTGSWFLLVGPG